MKEKSIQIGLKDELNSFRDIKAGSVEMPSQQVSHEKQVRPGKIISRLDHPVLLSYNGESIVIPPKGTRQIADCKKLGSLPRGVVSLADE